MHALKSNVGILCHNNKLDGRGPKPSRLVRGSQCIVDVLAMPTRSSPHTGPVLLPTASLPSPLGLLITKCCKGNGYLLLQRSSSAVCTGGAPHGCGSRSGWLFTAGMQQGSHCMLHASDHASKQKRDKIVSYI